MNKGLSIISYAFAAIAGICFVKGIAILAPRKGMEKHGQIKGDCINA